MKKETPFLDFYKECMETGKLPDEGLCYSFNAIDRANNLGLFYELHPEYGSSWYWAYGEDYVWRGLTRAEEDVIMYTFTPLRQTIVLFCAAINGEL